MDAKLSTQERVGVIVPTMRCVCVCVCVCVCQVVFGDTKAAYLLPWRRLFNITDAQVFVARRDNARAIFRAYLEQQGNDVPADRCVSVCVCECACVCARACVCLCVWCLSAALLAAWSRHITAILATHRQ